MPGSSLVHPWIDLKSINPGDCVQFVTGLHEGRITEDDIRDIFYGIVDRSEESAELVEAIDESVEFFTSYLSEMGRQ